MRSLQEALAAVQILRDKCHAAGASSTATRLEQLLTTFWTTSSEALVELLDALEQTRSEWERKLNAEDARVAQELMSDARDLLGFE